MTITCGKPAGAFEIGLAMGTLGFLGDGDGEGLGALDGDAAVDGDDAGEELGGFWLATRDVGPARPFEMTAIPAAATAIKTRTTIAMSRTRVIGRVLG
jgi:hypothetical protein